MTARETGARYESLALAYLERAGLKPLERNFNCRYGEIDLVMRDGDVIVFVEVRYRRRRGFGDGIDSIDAAKRAKLVRAAGAYLSAHPHLADRTCRFDAIAIGEDAQAPDWRRNAFDA